MNKCLYIFSLLVAVLAFSSCGNKDKAIYPFQEETKYLVVKLQGSDKWSIINIDNGEVIAKNAISGTPSAVHEDMFYVYDDSTARVNYYNVKDCSKPVNSSPYSSATSFNGGFAIASQPGGSLQVIDKDCKTVKTLPSEFNTAQMFLNERAVVKDDKNHFGFIDTKGETVIKATLGHANDFRFDAAALVAESASSTGSPKLIVIDKDGKTLFELNTSKYIPSDRYFKNGALKVMNKDTGEPVFLDKKGKEIDEPMPLPKDIKKMNYHEVKHAGKDRYMVVKGDRMGLVDDDNDVLVNIEYEYITNLTPSRYVVKKGSDMMIVDEKGKQVGSTKFVDFINSNNANECCQRGYVNPSEAADAILQLVGADMVFGVHDGTKLSELNQVNGLDPSKFVGVTELNGPQTPVFITYHFDRAVASRQTPLSTPSDSTDSTATNPVEPIPQFNADAVVQWVTLQYPVRQCLPSTEQEILKIVTEHLCNHGFTANEDGTLTSSSGRVVAAGYDKGVFVLNYYFDAANAEPESRKNR